MTAAAQSEPHRGLTRIAAIGEPERLYGLAFAGVRVLAAEDPQAAQAAWRSLPPEIGLVILTRAAHTALGAELPGRDGLLWAVVPT